jgi:hypothetical protein
MKKQIIALSLIFTFSFPVAVLAAAESSNVFDYHVPFTSAEIEGCKKTPEPFTGIQVVIPMQRDEFLFQAKNKYGSNVARIKFYIKASDWEEMMLIPTSFVHSWDYRCSLEFSTDVRSRVGVVTWRLKSPLEDKSGRLFLTRHEGVVGEGFWKIIDHRLEQVTAPESVQKPPEPPVLGQPVPAYDPQRWRSYTDYLIHLRETSEYWYNQERKKREEGIDNKREQNEMIKDQEEGMRWRKAYQEAVKRRKDFEK